MQTKNDTPKCPHCGHGGFSIPYGMNPQIHECNKCKGTWTLNMMETSTHTAPPVALDRLVLLEGEPEKQGRYYWREKNADEWKAVRVWWIDDMLREGWAYMLGRFEDSESSVDMRKLPKGQWAKDPEQNINVDARIPASRDCEPITD